MKTKLKQTLSATAVAVFTISSIGYIAFANPNYKAKIAEQEEIKQEENQANNLLRSERDHIKTQIAGIKLELTAQQARLTALEADIQVNKADYAAAQGKIDVYTELLNEGLAQEK